MKELISLQDLYDLHILLRRFYTPHKHTGYLFQLPHLSNEENLRYTTYINSYKNECGCNTGGFFMSMAFIITVVCYFILGGSLTSIKISDCIWLIGIVFCAALAGKIFGLLRARWKMIRLVSSLILQSNNASII